MQQQEELAEEEKLKWQELDSSLINPLISDFSSESVGTNGIDSDAISFLINSFAQNPTSSCFLSSSHEFETLGYSSTDSSFGYSTSSTSTDSVSSAVLLPPPLSLTHTIPSNLETFHNMSISNSQYCPASCIRVTQPQIIPYTDISKTVNSRLEDSSQNRWVKYQHSEHVEDGCTSRPFWKQALQKQHRREAQNESRQPKKAQYNYQSSKPGIKKADNREYSGGEAICHAFSPELNLHQNIRLRVPQPGARRPAIQNNDSVSRAGSQNAKIKNSSTVTRNLKCANKKSDRPIDDVAKTNEFCLGTQMMQRRGNKSIPGIIAGVAMVQRWIRGESRRNETERRLSFASTSASSIDEWGFGEESVDKVVNEMKDAADQDLESSKVSKDALKEHAIPLEEKQLNYGEVSSDYVSVNISDERTAWIESNTDAKRGNNELCHQCLNLPVEVFKPLGHIPHLKCYHDNIKKEENHKQQNPIMVTNNKSIHFKFQKQADYIDSHKEIQQHKSKLSSVNSINSNFQGYITNLIVPTQVPSVPVPTTQRIYTTSSASDADYKNKLQQCSNDLKRSGISTCLFQSIERHGLNHEVWTCLNQGDFSSFLESVDFEAHLSRNFLRLVYGCTSDQIAIRIIHKTLRMLRSCSYPPSDILQCVALALCHIRRAGSQILMANSVEAAYVGALQV